MTHCVCLHCGHSWTPRIYFGIHRPKICPHCKNRHWDNKKEDGAIDCDAARKLADIIDAHIRDCGMCAELYSE